MPAGLPVLLERKFQTRENNSEEREEHSLVWLFPQRIIIMRIKRFASVPLLGAMEENKRTTVPLAKAEPPPNSITALFVPIKGSVFELHRLVLGEAARLAPQSCQGS